MSQELLVSKPLMCEVHLCEVFRPKSSTNDYVFIHTNLPNPRGSAQQTVQLQLIVPRGLGADWARANFPGVELHEYDYTSGRIIANSPSRSTPARAGELIAARVSV